MELMLRTEGLCSQGQICWSTDGHVHSHIWRETIMHVCSTHLMDLQVYSTDNTHSFRCICAFSHKRTHFSFEYAGVACAPRFSF